MKAYIKKAQKYIAAQVIWDGLGVVCLAAAPLIQKWIFDFGLQSTWKKIASALAGYFAFLLLYSVSQYFCNLYSFKSGIRFETSVKKDFFASVFRMENQEFHEHSIGEYISLQGNDITALEQDYLQPLVDVIRSVNMMLIYGVVLFFGVDYRIALVLILSSLIAIFVPKIFGERLENSRSLYQKQMGEYVSTVTDLLEGFETIESRTMGSIESVHNKSLYLTAEKRMQYGKQKSFVLGLGEWMTKLVKILTLTVTVVLYCRGRITVGIGIATLSYLEAFLTPIDCLLYDITSMKAMGNVKEVILGYIHRPRTKKASSVKLAEKVVMEHVTYALGGFELKNINLTFERGKKYAIIGHSGSGKSTLLKLLKGYIKPGFGSICIDSQNIENVDLSETVAYLSQKEHIFKGGMEDNITIFGAYPKICAGEILDRIGTKLAESIRQKRQGENCQAFSGGEKQLVTFLRGIAKNAELVLMDEPFSAIDRNTKIKLYDYIFGSDDFKKKTIIMVTHDVDYDVLKRFDGVIKIDADGISEE